MAKTKQSLADEFTEILIRDYQRLRDTCETGDRSGVRFRGMITRLGGVGSAKRLLLGTSNKYRWWSVANDPDAWFSMVDNSVEFEVTRPRFRKLFTDEERYEARVRLKRMRELQTD